MKKLSVKQIKEYLLGGAFSVLLLVPFILVSCSSGNDSSTTKKNTDNSKAGVSLAEAEANPMKIKGVGPVKSVNLADEIDPAMVSNGKTIFESKCAACHQMDARYVGPPMGGITERRSPEWIMNMILNPEEMTQKDPLARAKFEEYLVQMVFQDVTEDETRAILEYFRDYDRQNQTSITQ